MQLIPKQIAKQISISRKALVRVIVALGIILLPIIIGLAFFLQHHGRIFPNVVLAGINVGGLTPIEAENLLMQNYQLPKEFALINTEGSSEPHQIPTSAFDARVDYAKSVEEAYRHGRSTKIKEDILTIINTLRHSAKYPPIVTFDSDLLHKQLTAYAETVTVEPVMPSVALINNEIAITKGEVGTEIDLQLLESKILENLTSTNQEPIVVDIQTVDKRLTDTQVLDTKLRAQKLIDKEINLEFERQVYTFDDQKLLSFIDPLSDYKTDILQVEVDNLSKIINREAQNPVFTFADGRVQEFKPSKDGVAVDKLKLIALLEEGLSSLEKDNSAIISYSIPATSTPPSISMDDVNDLGIKELIGRGTSQFKGSIPSRVYNIQLAASRLNGVLIKPGEEFSFNSALGDISALSGYKQAYIISNGRTILGDGGGVCQVSTTFFRSILDAGLPILERNQHSYRVSYYEQDSGPGLDAAIYTPTLDLKIRNDTPGHILIQTIPDTTNMTLVFELYGTGDGRESTIGKPIVTSTSAPPEPQYIDDPTLPTGQVKQVDFAAWGAKAQFDYKVTRNGETLIEKTFFSNYRPWQAKFLRGTGPAI